MTYVFNCLSCGTSIDPAERPAGCPECGGTLEVVHDDLPEVLPDSDRTDLWRYADWLPTEGLDLGPGRDSAGAPPSSMGEGWTPLVEASRLSATAAAEFDAEGPDCFLKNETANRRGRGRDRRWRCVAREDRRGRGRVADGRPVAGRDCRVGSLRPDVN